MARMIKQNEHIDISDLPLKEIYAYRKRYFNGESTLEDLKLSKKCRGCQQIKLLKDFPVNGQARDGHRNKCKECHNEQMKGYR